MNEPMMQDPSAQDAQPAGYTIEIEVAGDGSITVSVESDATEEGEAGQPGAPEDAGKQVADIREAIKVVLDIYQSQGQQPDTGAADEAMAQGYKPGL